MVIYNSLSERKEKLGKPLDGKAFKLFVCGPTVYDSPHLGHARVSIFFDFLKRYLKTRGEKVFYVQNITDIDDKIIERARKEGGLAMEVAKEYEKEYKEEMEKLGANSVDKYPQASKHIKEIIKQIRELINKGIAYQISSGVYFEVKKFADYGKLSKQNLDELRPGWRIEPDSEKKDPLDFVLWKTKKHDYEPSWQSPWGEGRPGWHIEDTAITEKLFGPQYDLHGGGMDLKFPHHESEIAQQESASGLKPFVRIWMHVGFLLINGEKMSKSLGNFVTIKEFLAKHSAAALRMAFFQHHYRSPIDYSEQLIESSVATLGTIKEFLAKIDLIKRAKKEGLDFDLESYEKEFQRAMEDDLNTPQALAMIFHLMNNLNLKMWTISSKSASEIAKWVDKKLAVFGLEMKLPKIPMEIKKMVRAREALRKKKDFEAADNLRKEIEEQGYLVQDTPEGALIVVR